MELDDMIEKGGLLGVSFGATRAQVEEVLGPPEDWTDAGPMILRYGDLQLSLENGTGLWLATIWNVAGRLRICSEDLDVDWGVTPERLLALLSRAGLEVPRAIKKNPGGVISAAGPHFRAEAVFDGSGHLEKLSLVRCSN